MEICFLRNFWTASKNSLYPDLVPASLPALPSWKVQWTWDSLIMRHERTAAARQPCAKLGPAKTPHKNINEVYSILRMRLRIVADFSVFICAQLPLISTSERNPNSKSSIFIYVNDPKLWFEGVWTIFWSQVGFERKSGGWQVEVWVAIISQNHYQPRPSLFSNTAADCECFGN